MKSLVTVGVVGSLLLLSGCGSQHQQVATQAPTQEASQQALQDTSGLTFFLDDGTTSPEAYKVIPGTTPPDQYIKAVVTAADSAMTNVTKGISTQDQEQFALQNQMYRVGILDKTMSYTFVVQVRPISDPNVLRTALLFDLGFDVAFAKEFYNGDFWTSLGFGSSADAADATASPDIVQIGSAMVYMVNNAGTYTAQVYNAASSNQIVLNGIQGPNVSTIAANIMQSPEFITLAAQ